jgi:hypothetical protein
VLEVRTTWLLLEIAEYEGHHLQIRKMPILLVMAFEERRNSKQVVCKNN